MVEGEGINDGEIISEPQGAMQGKRARGKEGKKEDKMSTFKFGRRSKTPPKIMEHTARDVSAGIPTSLKNSKRTDD